MTGVVAVVAGPATAAAKPRPDFKVLSVTTLNHFADPPHMFHNRPNSGPDLVIRVKNVGGKAAAGQGVIMVLGDGDTQITRLPFDVPRLKPGHVARILGDISGSFKINDYGTRVCARARRDARPGNNCRKGIRFAVIPEKWVGTTNSTVDDLGEVETCATSVTFTYNQMRSGAGKYVYLGGGSLSCTASGGNGGCTFAGSGDTSIEQILSTLSVNARLNGYNAVGASSKSYEGTETCPPDPPAAHTFYYSAWLATSNRGMLATDTTLSGSFPAPSGDVWSWNLGAQ